jgi:Leucine-rich repeat (LRR) protein
VPTINKEENKPRKGRCRGLRFQNIVLIHLIILMLSCTQIKANKDKQPTQTIPETTKMEQPSVNNTLVDDTIIIGGFRTDYRLSRPSMTYLISISKEKSNDLSGVEQLVHIVNLNLYLKETGAIDFSPLKSLPMLRNICIYGAALTDIPDLGGIPSLAILELINNSLTSLSGLEKIPQLELLRIIDAHESITDTSALRYLRNLRSFYIFDSYFNIDFTNLTYSPELEEIYFSTREELDLSGIGLLNQLKKLRLEIGVSEEMGEQGALINIQEIGKMAGLKELYLDEVITSVGFLANNANLERLELVAGRERPDYYTGALLPLDVEPLGNLKKLKHLIIRGFELKNTHVLDTLPELKTLNTSLWDPE